MSEPGRSVFRPTTSIATAVITWIILFLAGISAVCFAVIWGQPHRAWALVPLASVALIIWELYWRPVVAVNDEAVTLVNVFHTVTVPWTTIIALDTRWALTLVTPQGRYRATAAPAPGPLSRYRRGSAARHPSVDVAADRSQQASASIGTDSGEAMVIAKMRWEALRDAGRIETGRAEADRPRLQIHTATIILCATLIAASVPAIAWA